MESDEEMMEQEQDQDQHNNDDTSDDSTVNASTSPTGIDPTVIDLMEIAIELETVTPMQDTANIVPPGEHMVVYRNTVLLEKVLQQLLRQHRRSNTVNTQAAESPTQKEGINRTNTL
jgi:hypothetical protein